MQRATDKKRKQQQHKDRSKKQRQQGEFMNQAGSSSSSSFSVLAQDSGSDEEPTGTEPAAAAAGAASSTASTSARMAASSSTSAPSSASAAASAAAAAAVPSRSSPAAARAAHAPFVRPTPSPFVRVKAGNFSRLLYTNPVCLLSTAIPLAAATGAAVQTQAPVQTMDSNDDATVETQACEASVSANDAAVAPSAATAVASPAAPPTPSRNVMTITWLTATSNHGEFVCSMNASRFSAKMLAKAAAATAPAAAAASSSSSSSSAAAVPAQSDFVGGYFVLSVPVAGMEALVKSIGGCSGGDGPEELAAAGVGVASVPADKFARLGIQPCRPGGKPIRDEAPKLSPGAAAAAAASAGVASSASSKPAAAQKLSAQDEESLADAEDHALNLLAVPGCAAHLVCTVVSSCCASDPTPRVQAHNILFCVVKRAYVHKDYWLNGNNFMHTTPNTPPYLTFLGSGNFAHVTNPAFGKKQ